MNIAIYDKAFESILALPKGEQKAFLGMISKARKDSTMASLNLEAISTFRDKQLRTMRINQKYRAILRAPETGTTYTLLHVGNHDEAMAWAENKLFEWNPRTESYQVFTAAEAIPQEVAPTHQETNKEVNEDAFSGYTDDQLMDIGVPNALIPSVRTVEKGEDLEKLYEYLPIEALESLSMLLDGAEYHLLVQTIEDGKTGNTDTEAQRLSGNNLRSFLPLESDDLIDRMISGELSKWKVFLHPTQRKLVERNARGPVKVTGGAGTGKTVAALHRALWLQNRLGANNGAAIVFTTFTKTLAQNLRADASELGISSKLVKILHFEELFNELVSKTELKNTHTRIVGQHGQRSSETLFEEILDSNGTSNNTYDASFLAAEYRDVKMFNDLSDIAGYYTISRRGRGVGLTKKGRKEVWQLFEAYEKLKQTYRLVDRYELINQLSRYLEQAEVKPYHHLVADEVQDFSNVELRLLRALVAEGENDMFLVGDPLQRIYSGSVVFSRAGIQVRGRSTRLRLNYRTTDAIRRRAVAILKDEKFTDFDESEEDITGYRSLRVGQPPVYHIFKQRGEEADFIVNQIKDRLETHPSGFSLNDIVIACRTSSAAHDFRMPLERAGLSYEDLTDPSARGKKLKDGIRLSTFHNLKGLEFKVVFLADVSQGTWPLRPSGYNSWTTEDQKAHLKRERSLLYVAMTRAVLEVFLTGRGSLVKELG